MAGSRGSCASVLCTMRFGTISFVVSSLVVLACDTGARDKATPEPAVVAPSAASQKLGQATPTGTPEVSLATVARAPKEYLGKTLVTKGTVGSVCQHMGC